MITYPMCVNCQSAPQRRDGTRRCTRCGNYLRRHGTDWQPQPPRVELYYRGRCVATVPGCDDIGCNDVYLAQMRLAEAKRVPTGAVVPVLRVE